MKKIIILLGSFNVLYSLSAQKVKEKEKKHKEVEIQNITLTKTKKVVEQKPDRTIFDFMQKVKGYWRKCKCFMIRMA
ncbi:hypothetical protein [Chryseobacterium sp.]|uniref:hypothetical protein n=1 Tax=Chryseobacterium sp. TaxID=1871047 RepID=UPI0025C5AC95|nr:hypothetical protein [Chryseobacterium sp.]MBV8325179.1 hypothetical protein [Chryseobacterium sp.]